MVPEPKGISPHPSFKRIPGCIFTQFYRDSRSPVQRGTPAMARGDKMSIGIDSGNNRPTLGLVLITVEAVKAGELTIV